MGGSQDEKTTADSHMFHLEKPYISLPKTSRGSLHQSSHLTNHNVHNRVNSRTHQKNIKSRGSLGGTGGFFGNGIQNQFNMGQEEGSFGNAGCNNSRIQATPSQPRFFFHNEVDETQDKLANMAPIDVNQTFLSEGNEPKSLRISHESAGNSPGQASNNEKDFLFMTTMLQKKDDLGREVEEYRQLLEKQAITIKNLQS